MTTSALGAGRVAAVLDAVTRIEEHVGQRQQDREVLGPAAMTAFTATDQTVTSRPLDGATPSTFQGS